MRKIALPAVFLYLITISGFSQAPDSSVYKNRKLKKEEINFVTSYYQQDGNNSAVTGGKGSEHLTDFATTIDIKFSKYDLKGRKRTLTGEVGIDVYTSASSDKIDPNTISSASTSDKRIYPSLTYSIANEKSGDTWSFNGSVSTEYDYLSKGVSAGWTKLSKDRNRELGLKGMVFLDTWTVILPIELRSTTNIKGTKPRNSFSGSLTLSQVVNKRFQLALLADVAYQTGQLATLYHRVYFNNNTHKVEHLPDTRFKIPLGLRLHYFLGDGIILRGYYRYYQDNWDLKAQTFELESAIKITPFLSASPFYRHYKQDGTKYFAGYQQHNTDEEFYTSDYDLSTLTSNMMGMGLRYSPPGGVLNYTKLNQVELRYGYYKRSTGLNSNIITLLIKVK